MGMDVVFVCMAKKYYCPVENSKSILIDSTKLVDLCEKAEKTEPLLIGKKAPRLILADTSETKWIDFYKLQINTFFYFFGTQIVVTVKKKFLK